MFIWHVDIIIGYSNHAPHVCLHSVERLHGSDSSSSSRSGSRSSMYNKTGGERGRDYASFMFGSGMFKPIVSTLRLYYVDLILYCIIFFYGV